MDLVHGDAAGRDGGADAAAVGDADHLKGFFLLGAGFLGDDPDHRVGDQVAQVGLFGAVAGSAVAVEVHIGDGELLAVQGIHEPDHGVGRQRHLFVFGHGVNADGRGHQVVVLDLLGGVVDDDHADIGKRGAGGLDALAVFAGGHHGMAVAVNHEVNAVHLAENVQGTVAVGGGFGVHAQVEQAEDQVSVFPDPVHGALYGGVQFVKGGEVDLFDQGGIDLGGGLGGLNADKGNPQARVGLDRAGRRQDGLTGRIQDHVAADRREPGVRQVQHQLFIAVVEFVVAQGDDVIAGLVHHRDGGRAFGGAHVSGALRIVAGVGQDDVGAAGVEFLLQGGDVGIAADRAVDVVRVQDDRFALVTLGKFGLHVSRGGVFVAVHVRERGRDGQQHHQRHGQGQDLPGVHGDQSPFRYGLS